MWGGGGVGLAQKRNEHEETQDCLNKFSTLVNLSCIEFKYTVLVQYIPFRTILVDNSAVDEYV